MYKITHKVCELIGAETRKQMITILNKHTAYSSGPSDHFELSWTEPTNKR